MSENPQASVDLPTPKYRIGTTVWFATTDYETANFPCPDCKGERYWRVVSPAGTEHQVECPRCRGGFSVTERLPSLSYRRAVPRVRALTVGSVSAATHQQWDGDGFVKYMCVETGIGSGHVYREGDLHPDEAAATAVATAKANAANAEELGKPEVLTRREFSYLTFNVAMLKAISHAYFDAGYRYGSLRDEIGTLLDDQSIARYGELREAIRDALDSDAKYVEPTTLQVMITAIRQAVETGDVSSLRTLPLDELALLEAPEKAKASEDFLA